MKAYFWKPDKDELTGIAVIADNLKEAKRLGYSFWGSEYGHDLDFTDQRCSLLKEDYDIEGLPKGVVEGGIDGLKRGLYDYIEDDCPACGNLSQIYKDDETLLGIGCHDCLYPEDDW